MTSRAVSASHVIGSRSTRWLTQVSWRLQ